MSILDPHNSLNLFKKERCIQTLFETKNNKRDNLFICVASTCYHFTTSKSVPESFEFCKEEIFSEQSKTTEKQTN